MTALPDSASLDSPPDDKGAGSSRWAFHFLLLGSYPILLGSAGIWWPVVAGWFNLESAPSEEKTAALSADISILFTQTIFNLLLFAAIFLIAFRISRTHWRDVPWLKSSGWLKAFGLGFLYSIGLRFAVAIAMIGAILLMALTGTSPENILGSLIPRVDRVVDIDSLSASPAYFWLCVTWISFVVAGLREELWRLGVYVAWKGLFPQSQKSPAFQWLGMLFIAFLFGLGHLPQGLGGVLTTTVLGFGLGAIMLVHKSLWPAVLAHGFLDATSFALIPLVSDRLKGFLDSPFPTP